LPSRPQYSMKNWLQTLIFMLSKVDSVIP
jgi:hypothetical protein